MVQQAAKATHAEREGLWCLRVLERTCCVCECMNVARSSVCDTKKFMTACCMVAELVSFCTGRGAFCYRFLKVGVHVEVSLLAEARNAF